MHYSQLNWWWLALVGLAFVVFVIFLVIRRKRASLQLDLRSAIVCGPADCPYTGALKAELKGAGTHFTYSDTGKSTAERRRILKKHEYYSVYSGKLTGVYHPVVEAGTRCLTRLGPDLVKIVQAVKPAKPGHVILYTDDRGWYCSDLSSRLTNAQITFQEFEVHRKKNKARRSEAEAKVTKAYPGLAGWEYPVLDVNGEILVHLSEKVVAYWLWK